MLESSWINETGTPRRARVIEASDGCWALAASGKRLAASESYTVHVFSLRKFDMEDGVIRDAVSRHPRRVTLTM